ncbi:hypothetical protein V8C35DRAFT_133926 [Trichoderma chlorosporum]
MRFHHPCVDSILNCHGSNQLLVGGMVGSRWGIAWRNEAVMIGQPHPHSPSLSASRSIPQTLQRPYPLWHFSPWFSRDQRVSRLHRKPLARQTNGHITNQAIHAAMLAIGCIAVILACSKLVLWPHQQLLSSAFLFCFHMYLVGTAKNSQCLSCPHQRFGVCSAGYSSDDGAVGEDAKHTPSFRLQSCILDSLGSDRFRICMAMFRRLPIPDEAVQERE